MNELNQEQEVPVRSESQASALMIEDLWRPSSQHHNSLREGEERVHGSGERVGGSGERVRERDTNSKFPSGNSPDLGISSLEIKDGTAKMLLSNGDQLTYSNSWQGSIWATGKIGYNKSQQMELKTVGGTTITESGGYVQINKIGKGDSVDIWPGSSGEKETIHIKSNGHDIYLKNKGYKQFSVEYPLQQPSGGGYIALGDKTFTSDYHGNIVSNDSQKGGKTESISNPYPPQPPQEDWHHRPKRK